MNGGISREGTPFNEIFKFPDTRKGTLKRGINHNYLNTTLIILFPLKAFIYWT